jgi:hypothetical protein
LICRGFAEQILAHATGNRKLQGDIMELLDICDDVNWAFRQQGESPDVRPQDRSRRCLIIVPLIFSALSGALQGDLVIQ